MLLLDLLGLVCGKQFRQPVSPIIFHLLLLLLLLLQFCGLDKQLFFAQSLLVGQAVDAGLQRLQHVILMVAFRSAERYFAPGALQRCLELFQLLPPLVLLLQQLGSGTPQFRHLFLDGGQQLLGTAAMFFQVSHLGSCCSQRGFCLFSPVKGERLLLAGSSRSQL